MRRSADERGWAMLWACMLLLAAGTLTAVLLERDQAMRRDARQDAAVLRALHAVEGGLAHARHSLARDPAHTGATMRVGDVEVRTVVRKTAHGIWSVEVRAPGHGRGIRAELRAAAGLPRVASRSAI